RHPRATADCRVDRHGASPHGHGAQVGDAGVSGTPSAGGDGDLGPRVAPRAGGWLFRVHGATARQARVRPARAGGVRAGTLGRVQRRPRHAARRFPGARVPGVARGAGAPHAVTGSPLGPYGSTSESASNANDAPSPVPLALSTRSTRERVLPSTVILTR